MSNEKNNNMKALLNATIVALLSILSISCDGYDSDYDGENAYYTFEDKTWSRIEESAHYNYFVCYDFYKDGTYKYWFYEYDNGIPVYSVETGRWEIVTHSRKSDIKLYANGRSDVYDIDEFLDGLSCHNFRSDIDDYKRLIDELYYHD